ncbi:DUF3122 domain-containing protein [Prochlorococcus marinus]|uniref:DUF3122 domain-containing protein n=1 Tax=Prochlorococcus marinus TaxID=1219 RepID=UPI0022B2CDF4|nr:DUF3122 domain-containing protein [Prochlorococcus marinus]
MEGFRNLFRLIIFLLLIFCCLFSSVNEIYADSKVNLNDQKKEIKRSLESLKDLDYQTWQIIVYPSSKDSKKLILRIVGYPGSLRIDHPTDLIVNSGRKTWDLKDISKNSKFKVETLNDSAAEFDLSNLIAQLDKNRPLRLKLPGLINDLPIPPYLVSEWRSLAE